MVEDDDGWARAWLARLVAVGIGQVDNPPVGVGLSPPARAALSTKETRIIQCSTTEMFEPA